MDRLDAMRIFVRVAELGSFSAVAQQMDLARSAVTRQIAALEKHLGVKLMARSTRSLTLTAEGTRYLEKCRVILNLVDMAETGLAEETAAPRGHIRIGLPLTFGLNQLTPLLLDFMLAYPEVSMEMDYTDRRVNLIEEGVDIALRITGRLDDTDIVRKLGECHLYTVASPAYLARCGTPVVPADLLHHECLVYQTNSGRMPWNFQANGRVESINVRSRVLANNGEALIQAAINQMGVTQAPDFIAKKALAAGQVIPILENFAAPALGIYAVLPGNRYVPQRVRVLIDFLAAQLSSACDQEKSH